MVREARNIYKVERLQNWRQVISRLLVEMQRARLSYDIKTEEKHMLHYLYGIGFRIQLQSMELV